MGITARFAGDAESAESDGIRAWMWDSGLYDVPREVRAANESGAFVLWCVELSGCGAVTRFRWIIASLALAGGYASDIIVCSENG